MSEVKQQSSRSERRFVAAKDILAALAGSPEVVRDMGTRFSTVQDSRRFLCRTAVNFADILLEELDRE